MPRRAFLSKRLVDRVIGMIVLVVSGIAAFLTHWGWRVSSDRYVLLTAMERMVQRVEELEKVPKTWVDRQEWDAVKETLATKDIVAAVEKRLADQIAASCSKPEPYSTLPQPTFREPPSPWVVSTPVPWTLRVDNLTGVEQLMDVNGRTYSIPSQGAFIPVLSEGLFSCELRPARMAKIVSIGAPNYFGQIQIVSSTAPQLR